MVERVGGPQCNILDLCCGQGTLTAMLCESGANVCGLDFSEKMLELAAKAAPDADLKHGDATNLPYDSQSFDAVLCNFGMMHLPDQPRALSEIQRVLSPSGGFIMATWAAPDVSPAFGTVFGALKSNADFSEAPPQPDLFAFADPSTAEEMLSQGDLKLTNHEFVTATWELERPEGLFEIFLNGTVSAALLIKSQTKEIIEKIKADIAQKVETEFQDDEKFKVPVSMAMVTAQLRLLATLRVLAAIGRFFAAHGKSIGVRFWSSCSHSSSIAKYRLTSACSRTKCPLRLHLAADAWRYVALWQNFTSTSER